MLNPSRVSFEIDEEEEEEGEEEGEENKSYLRYLQCTNNFFQKGSQRWDGWMVAVTWGSWLRLINKGCVPYTNSDVKELLSCLYSRTRCIVPILSSSFSRRC